MEDMYAMGALGLKITDPFDRAPLDWTYKGLPEAALGLCRHELGGLRLPLFESNALFPLAILREDVMRSNSAWMMRFLGALGAVLAPHGKTTMSPDLMRMQLEDGAWGLTAATVHHVRAYRRWGVQRILMANQLVGDAEIRWIADELARDPDFEFFCLVDSVEGARLLARALEEAGATSPLQVLLEIGIVGGRTGVRSVDEGIEVANIVASLPQLELCGIETFEGLFQTEEDGAARAAQMLETTVEVARHCDRGGLFAGDTVLLTGGGSGLFDLAAMILSDSGLAKSTKVVIRSGCYLVHDDGIYRSLFEQVRSRIGDPAELEGGLRSALQVWARVQSKPESGRMICGLGKRDIGADCGLPMLVGWVPGGASTPQDVPAQCTVTGLNDQHAYVDGPCDSFAVGDLVGFGVSHPCTTFDKWRALVTVDSDFHVTGLIRTYF